jgi:hypothetical protein
VVSLGQILNFSLGDSSRAVETALFHLFAIVVKNQPLQNSDRNSLEFCLFVLCMRDKRAGAKLHHERSDCVKVLEDKKRKETPLLNWYMTLTNITILRIVLFFFPFFFPFFLFPR